MQRIILEEITLTELADQITAKVKVELQELVRVPNTQDQYLTRKETAKLLKVSLTTLNTWSKKGIIQAYQIEGKILYKRAEIENALSIVKNLKFKRNG
jgi:excisionase family DNA binding protein